MDEVEVEAGHNLPLIARHDTYGISFGREAATCAPSTTQGATRTATEGTTLPACASSPTEPADAEPRAAGVSGDADVSPAAEGAQPISPKQDEIKSSDAVRSGVPMQVFIYSPSGYPIFVP